MNSVGVGIIRRSNPLQSSCHFGRVWAESAYFTCGALNYRIRKRCTGLFLEDKAFRAFFVKFQSSLLISAIPLYVNLNSPFHISLSRCLLFSSFLLPSGFIRREGLHKRSLSLADHQHVSLVLTYFFLLFLSPLLSRGL